MVNICMSFKGTLFSNNDLNQNSVSFMHMFNACLSCLASSNHCIKYVGGVTEIRTILLSVMDRRMYRQARQKYMILVTKISMPLIKVEND